MPRYHVGQTIIVSATQQRALILSYVGDHVYLVQLASTKGAKGQQRVHQSDIRAA